MIFGLIVVATATITAITASAQESAAFLKLGVGARAIGMGGAYTAVADDVSAIAWNPAGLSSLAKRELGVTHAELAAGARYDFLAYGQPTKYGVLAAGAIYLTQSAIGGRDASGRPTGSYGASDTALNVGYASKLASGLRLGGGLKYIRSSIAEQSAQSYALDLGGQYELGRAGPGTPRLGLAILNLGPGLRFVDENSPLPLTVAAGVGYRLPVGLVLALDYKNHPHSRTSQVSIGTEYALFSSFALRAGYGTTKPAGSAVGPAAALSGMAAGFGLKFLGGYTLAYAMPPFGELGNVQRFSLGARF